MDNQFLRQVAGVFQNDNLEDYTFIFPNRRSSLFFKKYLGELRNKPFFSPRILTISELFAELSPLKALDNLPLMLELWEVWTQVQLNILSEQAVEGEQAQLRLENLDDFIVWGGIILSDFSTIDQYIIPAQSIFQNLKDLGQIHQDWSFLNSTQTAALSKLMGLQKNLTGRGIKKKYFDLWNMMLPVYESFHKRLHKEGKAYPAMQARFVAESILDRRTPEECTIVKDKLAALKQVAFVGFSAPTECEKVLMRCFSDKDGFGLFYWDFYSDMLKASHNRSSLLISKCVAEFKCSRPIADKNGGLKRDKCKFSLIPAGGYTEQAMLAASILKEIMTTDTEPIDTAVVISDEMLLLPLLGLIEDMPINVTMGYPLRATAASSFIISLMNLHTRASVRRENKIYLSGNILRSILNHSYVQMLSSKQTSAASDYIMEANMIYIDSSILAGEKPLGVEEESVQKLLQLLIPTKDMFPAEGQSDNSSELLKAIVAYQRNIIEYIAGYLPSRERSFLNVYHDILDGLYSYNMKFSRFRTIYSILRSYLKSAMIAFRGEPLQGVQIMGPLETRALDFERIIILSFNEGIYPANGVQASSIPYFLRKSFGLPTYEDNDSISAYNFYRLIQRAQEVYMIYDTTTTDSSRAKEESRFVKQLVYDFGVELCKKQYRFPLPSSTKRYEGDIVLNSTDIKRFRRFFSDYTPLQHARYLSPTSLNMYINCQRKFFLAKILGVADDAELSDTVEANTYGDIYHKCMQMLYDSFKTKEQHGLYIDSDIADKIQEKAKDDTYIDNLIQLAFEEVMHISTIEGENLIIKESVKKYIKQTLVVDSQRAEISPFTLVANEYPISMSLHSCYMSATLDRYEKEGSLLRVCDYKTGVFLDVSQSDMLEKLKSMNFGLRNEIPLFPYKQLTDTESEEILNAVFSREKRERYYEILFQLLFYALLLSRKLNYSGDIELTVFQLRIIDKCGPVTLGISSEFLQKFDERLKLLTEELRAKASENTSAVFSVCQNTAVCAYCDFNKYCRRSS